MYELSQLTFTIPGRVAGKGRPRAFVRAGKIGTYTPEKTRANETMVRTMAQAAMQGAAVFTGPLALELRCYIIPPASWSKKRREEAIFVTGKPDVDNVCKLIADSLNGIVYRDDSQIATLRFERWYAINGPERVEVTVRSLPTALARAA